MANKDYSFGDFATLVNEMQGIVHNNVEHYQTDAMYDASNIATAIDEGTLPREAFWITRESGTHFSFNDERIINSMLSSYVDSSRDSLLNKSENEHCYKIDFAENEIFEVEPKEFVFMVENAIKNAEYTKEESIWKKSI